MFMIVNHKHKQVTHESGFLLLFYKRRDAQKWLLDNEVPETWRPIVVEVVIEETPNYKLLSKEPQE